MLYDKTKQRERLLQILNEAPTEILLNAVEDFKAFKLRQAEAMSSVFKYFGDGRSASAQAGAAMAEKIEVTIESTKVVEESKAKAKMIKPPGVPAGKIGSETEAAAIGWLRNGPASLESLAVAMKRNEKIAETLLARLWEKKKVLYRSDKLYCLP